MKKIITALLILCVSAGAGAQTSPNGKIKAIAKGDSIKISYRDGGKWQQICSAEVKGISGLTRKISDASWQKADVPSQRR